MISEVQFRSALIGRSFYFAMDRSTPEWRREINTRSVERLPAKEPSLLPFAAALLYRAADGERLWIPRLLSTLAWMLGGVFLCLTAVRLLSPAAAVAGTAYYLEARQKEGSGSDHLSVAWEIAPSGGGPTIVPLEPIPGLFLAPHHLNYRPAVPPGWIPWRLCATSNGPFPARFRYHAPIPR